MSRRYPASIGTDFDGVVAFLKQRGIVPASPPGQMLALSKRLHRATFSLILWKFRLKKLPDHSQVFIEEIASDALQILPQCLMGYGKTAKLLIRGVIENTVRHLYFSDHPVEFQRMNREKKWYPELDELFDYPHTHPALLGAEQKFDAVNRIRTLYNELSAGVHGRRVQDLEMRTALQEIKFSETGFVPLVDATERCAASTNFLLATFHADQVRGFQQEDQQVILRLMPARARQVWRGLH